MSAILYADCSVSYDGRAQSELERGHYLIVFKDDGSVLIHGADLCVPLNYMGAGSAISYDYGMITCRRNGEVIIITIYDVISRINPANWSSHKIRLVRTEAELRDKLVANLSYYIPGVVFTSVVPEARTEVGPCDILAIDDQQRQHVIEIKRHRISVSSVVQLRKYIDGLWNKWGHIGAALGTDPLPVDPIGYVAAPLILDSAQRYCDRHGIIYIPVEF